MSDLDIFEHKSSLYQQNIQKRLDDFVPMRDINQEWILKDNILTYNEVYFNTIEVPILFYPFGSLNF